MSIRNSLVALSIILASSFAANPGGAAPAASEPQATITLADAAGSVDQRPPPVRPMTTLEKEGVGCLVSGGGALATAYAIGPSEIIMLLMGGLVVPSSSSVLLVSLIGTLTSVACGAGVYAEPLVEWALDTVTSAEASTTPTRGGVGVALLGSGVSPAAVGGAMWAQLPGQAQ